jgi:hypothetical protein
MIKAIPLQSFEHNGTKTKGNIYEFPDQTARQLADKGLVELLPSGIKKNIEQSSAASQAEQVSQNQTVIKSETGVSQRRTKKEK